MPSIASLEDAHQVLGEVFIAAFSAGSGTTIVVSPLIALMQDQVDALRGSGVPAAALHSQQGDAEQREAVAAFLRGELVLLYVSP